MATHWKGLENLHITFPNTVLYELIEYFNYKMENKVLASHDRISYSNADDQI